MSISSSSVDLVLQILNYIDLIIVEVLHGIQICTTGCRDLPKMKNFYYLILLKISFYIFNNENDLVMVVKRNFSVEARSASTFT